jgi:DNA-binding NarL/FixJ family response regulator
MKEMRFLIVEDQTVLRELLMEFLRNEFAGCKVASASSLAQTREVDRREGPFDLAIVDLELPDGNSLDWVLEYTARTNHPKAIVLTSISQEVLLFRVLQSSLPGFVHKDDGTAALLLAIKSVMQGAVFLSPTAQNMRSQMSALPDFWNKVLTTREQEVLGYLGQGMSDDEVATILGLKKSGVAEHRKRIMQKLGLHTSFELVKYAVEKGFSTLKPTRR